MSLAEDTTNQLRLPRELMERIMVLAAQLPGQDPSDLRELLYVLLRSDAMVDALERAVFPHLPETAMDAASARGSVAALELRVALGLPRDEYTHRAVEDACKAGHLAVLQWWVASGLKLKFSHRAVDLASQEGHVAVLEWAFATPVHFVYSEQAVDYASWKGQLPVLQWWAQSGLEMMHSHVAVDAASWNGHVAVLDWWLATVGRDALKFSIAAIDSASANGQLASLDWWTTKAGVKLRYSAAAIDRACARGHVAVLDWWARLGLPLDYSAAALDQASTSGHVAVLEWFAERPDLKSKFTRTTIDRACAANKAVGDFWAKSGWLKASGASERLSSRWI
ncbi:hypothetical protein H9P43_006598 [Blastocladiella emersonii ATCC 22665]|nr:hypothetical protein H9P43_006598 [Blastocladiella emersonii ATCC 22665]